jgi:hypothetical protein
VAAAAAGTAPQASMEELQTMLQLSQHYHLATLEEQCLG